MDKTDQELRDMGYTEEGIALTRKTGELLPEIPKTIEEWRENNRQVVEVHRKMGIISNEVADQMLAEDLDTMHLTPVNNDGLLKSDQELRSMGFSEAAIERYKKMELM